MLIERPKPIVDQVDTILRQRIRNREYAPGSRLPSESDLATEFGVSRATVRTVLATLAAERLIIRKQGDGTYVNRQVRQVNTNLGGIWDFYNIIENSGHKPSIQEISTEQRSATEQEASRLDIAPGEQVLALIRLFLADDQPVIFSTNVVPVNILNQNGHRYEARLPIHKFLKQYSDQEIAYVISDIGSTLAGPQVIEALRREPGSPLLQFTEVFYSEDNQPLAFGTNYYDDKQLRLRVVQPWG